MELGSTDILLFILGAVDAFGCYSGHSKKIKTKARTPKKQIGNKKWKSMGIWLLGFSIQEVRNVSLRMCSWKKFKKIFIL